MAIVTEASGEALQQHDTLTLTGGGELATMYLVARALGDTVQIDTVPTATADEQADAAKRYADQQVAMYRELPQRNRPRRREWLAEARTTFLSGGNLVRISPRDPHDGTDTPPALVEFFENVAALG